MNSKIATILELQAIPYRKSEEPLVNLAEECEEILCDYRRADAYVGRVLVRQPLVDRLRKVQQRLLFNNPKIRLLVVEGFRNPLYQERYFLEQLLCEFRQEPALGFDLLLERTHRKVSLPSIAGHPTGGAVDLTLIYEGREIDLGCPIADFSRPELLPTYSSFITPGQTEGRKLLHDAMVAEGFAPFYGEWWHFSYGDREWAAFYGLPEALFNPIEEV